MSKLTGDQSIVVKEQEESEDVREEGEAEQATAKTEEDSVIMQIDNLPQTRRLPKICETSGTEEVIIFSSGNLYEKPEKTKSDKGGINFQ